jgi:hypothetical protein
MKPKKNPLDSIVFQFNFLYLLRVMTIGIPRNNMVTNENTKATIIETIAQLRLLPKTVVNNKKNNPMQEDEISAEIIILNLYV